MRVLPFLNVELASLQQQWVMEDITAAFFKCTRWQREDTMDVVNCPHHYFCDSVYPGHYPAAVDIAVLFVAAVSFLSAMAFAVMEILVRTQRLSEVVHDGRVQALLRRYVLPSGPVVFPLLILALANGHRIGAIFSLSTIGPAIFQLILISALAFQNPVDGSLKNTLLECSTVSGILHASLYLESVVMPLYTGLDALVVSTPSGECPTCVCRGAPLKVGGTVVTYRAWSPATFAVAGTLLSRLACMLLGEERPSSLAKLTLEAVAWVLVAWDCIYLAFSSPGIDVAEMAAYGAVCVLMCVTVMGRVSAMCLACQPQTFMEKNHNTISRAI